MSKADSRAGSPPGKPQKPNKPYPDFPLFAHAVGLWAKKIKGRMHYFGTWSDPDAALAKYLAEKDALHAGRKPRAQGEGLTVKELCNSFLNAKQALVDSGELTQRSWDDYRAACGLCVEHFGKSRLVADLDPDDYAKLRAALAKRWGPVTLGNVIQRIRVAFKFAFDGGLIDRPTRYGQAFKRPTRKVLRVDRAKKGPKLFSAAQVRTLIDGAQVAGEDGPEPVRPGKAMRAMILLGINCGLGNADCGRLTRSSVDLDAGMIDLPRPKTGIARRCALWPETVAAIREATAARPTPRHEADAGLVFITKYGLPWAKDSADQTLAKEFGKLLRALGVGGRTGLGFYTLRHVFRTVADEAKDQPAVDFAMGHESGHMSGHYRETISDARLKAVSDYVRKWLFDEQKNG